VGGWVGQWGCVGGEQTYFCKGLGKPDPSPPAPALFTPALAGGAFFPGGFAGLAGSCDLLSYFQRF
jgi:hypothetical protein